jgi:hypothetical protein
LAFDGRAGVGVAFYDLAVKYGLSDRDRERLQRSREEAEQKMAAERSRLERKRAEALANRERLGPVEVADPDGATWTLCALPSGKMRWNYDQGLSMDSSGWSIPIILVMWLGNQFVHWVFFFGGWTLHVIAPDRKDTRIRARSQAEAADRLRQIKGEIERRGLGALGSLR